MDADEIGQPVAGTVYEDLLALVPGTEATHRYTRLIDYAGVMDRLGIVMPASGPPEEALDELLASMNDAAMRTGFAPEFPVWPFASRDYLSNLHRSPYVGFEHWRIEQSVQAGDSFFPRPNREGPPQTYDIALGDFDPDRTADALAFCDCDQPDIREYDGVEYYSWGTEYIGEIEKRHAPPLYDHVGRGPRLLIRNGQGFYSISNNVMEQYIAVLQGDMPSLASADGYLEVVQAFASLGLMRDMTFVSSGLAADEAIDLSGQPTLFPEVLNSASLLRRFDLVASGVGFDGTGAFTGLVISNPNNETAEFNADTLIERVRNVPLSTRSDATLSERLDRMEVAVVGNLVLAKFYYRDLQRHLFGFPLLGTTTIVVHE